MACPARCALQELVLRFPTVSMKQARNRKVHIEDLFGDPLVETDDGVSLYMLAAEVSSDFPGTDALSEFGNGLTIAEELDDLRDDLQKLEEGWVPDADDLQNAPALEEWGLLNVGEALPRIVGRWINGSLAGTAIRDGQQMSTLQILATDKYFAWARDRRGFYRLGTPAQPH